ncbi:hypothetical protein ACFWNE_33415 [Streptomyces goshikiensis]|uniref:hypothetical protein n=1 Tax=Streptomyces goshikiensis TaxID=1942 RepID=UPI0036631FDD
MTTTARCIEHLTRHVPSVAAITLCGSHRQGTSDIYSDRDIWVFCHNDQPISEHLATTAFLPADADCEILFEGRDDTLTDHTVVNVLADTEVLNLKLLHTRVLTSFSAQDPNLDSQYLEDLENYATMRVLHDPDGVIATHQQWLRHHAVDTIGDWLLPALASRYASTYWRSVYQGVLRTEEHAWRHLATHLAELLAQTGFAQAGALPPPRKWLLSPRVLSALPEGAALTALLDRLHRTSTTDPDAVLGFYRALAAVEDRLLHTGELYAGMWWRGVFTERITHLARHTGRPDLLALAQAAPRPRTAP